MSDPDQAAVSSRPTPSDYRRWIEADARLLLDAACSAPQAPVPTCPGWTARDVVDHTGEVYAHKVAAMRLGRRPQEGEWPWAPDDDSVFGWFSDRLAELLHELGSRDPASPAWTWFDEDQTVGFWARRMAHETAIHRVDAELAAGRSPTAHDEVLAVDGVDELVGTFLASDDVLESEARDTGSCGTVLVDAGVRCWLLDLPDGGTDVTVPARAVESDAQVAGSATDLYRALWNRPTDGAVRRGGDAEVLRRLDARLRDATE
ncbi:MAG TPA: maleylpyruvate isomerase N-terminal domain-containing protein [Actinomycetales bacterium]|nr:maleylpyruvate isomerase N-terminal domain-containing protein [Actinomycetales bacterium]